MSLFEAILLALLYSIAVLLARIGRGIDARNRIETTRTER